MENSASVLYKGVSIKSSTKVKNDTVYYVVVEFNLNGSDYTNRTPLNIGDSADKKLSEYSKLVEWAKTIIDDNTK